MQSLRSNVASNEIKVENYLSHLNRNDLIELMNSEDRFNKLLQNILHDYLINAVQKKKLILADQLSIAECNLSQKDRLNDLQSKLMKFIKEGEFITRELNKKQERIVLTSTNNLQNAVTSLQKLLNETQAISDQTEKEFLERKLDVDKFTENYLLIRTNLHLRNVKYEKLSEMAKKRSITLKYG